MQQLKRSKQYRIFGGVAGGLAKYFNIDPVIVRLLFVLTFLWGGTSLLVYLILWLILPENNNLPGSDFRSAAATGENPEEVGTEANPDNTGSSNENGGFVVGIVLIFLGVLFLLESFIPAFYFREYWPLLLVLIGIVLVINSVSDNSDNESPVGNNGQNVYKADKEEDRSEEEGFRSTNSGANYS